MCRNKPPKGPKSTLIRAFKVTRFLHLDGDEQCLNSRQIKSNTIILAQSYVVSSWYDAKVLLNMSGFRLIIMLPDLLM